MNTNEAFNLLIIGVDSGDRHLIGEWAKDGSLPTFARLMETSTWGDSRNPTGMVAGTVWPTFYSSVLPGRTGRFRGTTQFVSGTYEHADIDLHRFSYPTFWDALSDLGKQCIVIDAPYAFLSEKPNVTQLVDWCSHSAWKDGYTISRPTSLAGQIKEEFGRDPLGKCDFVTLETAEDFAGFRDGLINRINTRTELTLKLLSERRPELLMNIFSECHCAGHQLWHLHDPSHPLHDNDMVNALGGDPLKEVYKALDRALGRIIDSLDSSQRLLVFCSHGIGPAYTGTHLLDEVLLRLEGVPSPRKRQSLAQNMVAVWTRLPRGIRKLFTPLQKLLWPKLKANLVQPGKARRKFFEIIVNDASGGVRLNVHGREPNGIVNPGKEYDDICAMLESEILKLVDPVTKKPIVARVVRPPAVYSGDHVDALPDLLVVWSREHAISEAYSDRVGKISRRFVFTNHRTGDHTEDDGLFFLSGEGVSAANLGSIAVADLAPTIVRMFGGTFVNVDGEVVDAMSESSPQPIAAVNA